MFVPAVSRVLLLLVFFCAPHAAIASGSFNFGAGGGALQDTYNQGKVALYKKVICDSCPIPTDGLDEAIAQAVLAQVKQAAGPIASLASGERQAVIYYLEERFGLK